MRFWRDNRDDPGLRNAVKRRKQKKAGTDPETQQSDERKVWFGAAIVSALLGLLAGRSG